MIFHVLSIILLAKNENSHKASLRLSESLHDEPDGKKIQRRKFSADFTNAVNTGIVAREQASVSSPRSTLRLNDHIFVHGMRGFVSDDLIGAFKEIEATSKGTRCRQHLFSLCLNPLERESAPPAYFETAIETIEKKLGLSKQRGERSALGFTHTKNERGLDLRCYYPSK